MHISKVSQKWHTPKPLASPSKMAQFEYLWGLQENEMIAITIYYSVLLLWLSLWFLSCHHPHLLRFHQVSSDLSSYSYVYYYYPYYLCLSTFSLVDRWSLLLRWSLVPPNPARWRRPTCTWCPSQPRTRNADPEAMGQVGTPIDAWY